MFREFVIIFVVGSSMWMLIMWHFGVVPERRERERERRGGERVGGRPNV